MGGNQMASTGFYTKTDLTDFSWFFQANQGKLSREGARFGLELAQFSYDFHATPWLNAGWTDIVLQVDQHLLSGLRAGQEERDWRQQTLNALVPRLARGLSVIVNPFNDLRGTLRAELATETGKAVTMILPQPKGKYIIAIGFMGTGGRPQDWANNMRFRHPEYFHEGFSAIAAQFEQNTAAIGFPSAAKALGLERLTLRDALEACREEDSPFRLVVAGHSQGAAVMQIWMYRQLQTGLLPRHMTGFGFASPKAAIGMSQADLEIPVTNFLAGDDIFTRLGMRQHLGKCYLLRGDEDLRAHCYGEMMKDKLFLRLLDIYNSQRCIDDSLILCLGYLEALSRRPYRVISTALSTFFDTRLADLPAIAEKWVKRVISLTIRGFRQHYQDAAGREPGEDEVGAAKEQMEALMAEYGAVTLTRMIVKALRLTHSLVNTEPGRADLAPYSYMAVRAFDRLEPVDTSQV
jgi:hypothetical protein